MKFTESGKLTLSGSQNGHRSGNHSGHHRRVRPKNTENYRGDERNEKAQEIRAFCAIECYGVIRRITNSLDYETLALAY